MKAPAAIERHSCNKVVNSIEGNSLTVAGVYNCSVDRSAIVIYDRGRGIARDHQHSQNCKRTHQCDWLDPLHRFSPLKVFGLSGRRNPRVYGI
jgi:hypothetical protein